MLHLFIDVRSGNVWTLDEAGDLFVDLATARETAFDIIVSVARDEKRDIDREEFAVRIRDEAGTTRFEASFSFLNFADQPA